MSGYGKNCIQGETEIKNWSKYRGTKNPRYLSSFEKVFHEWADRSTNVIEWSAENIVVKYYNPVKQRQARYIVDIWMKYRTKDGEIRTALIEIKPEAQTRPPKKGGNRSKKTRLNEECTWAVNSAKWNAAKAYAEERGWEFRIITENAIFRG